MSGGWALVGRDVECARLDALLEAARERRSSVLVVRGEPGLGKTALLNGAARRAEDMTVLRTSGAEFESGLPFAALHALLRPLLSQLNALPAPQTMALRAAFALADGKPPDRFAAYVATLSLLARAAEAAPVLALIDDAHWLDPSSAEALLFTARRVEAEGIALVFAARDGELDRFEAPGQEEVRLGGLDHADAGQLLNAHVTGHVAPTVVARLADDTGGNPLALIELSDLLSAAALAGEEPLGDPLAAGEAVRSAFLRRAAGLSPPASRALVVAAAAGNGELAPVVSALDALQIGSEALADAELTGLIAVDHGRLVFQHPLVRSAIYTAADPAERRRVHAALAAAYGLHRPDRRAWHLAAATLAPDSEVADALATVAETSRARSGYAAAARAFERAARLTPRGGPRVERLLAGAESARQAGGTETALRLLVDAESEASEPQLRAEIGHRRGRLEWFRGRPRLAQRLYLEAAEFVEPVHPSWAALLLTERALAAQDAGDADIALASARRARAIAPRNGEIADLASEAILGVSLFWVGDSAEAHKTLSHAIARWNDQQHDELEPEELLFSAEWRVWSGVDVEVARAMISEVTHQARATAALGVLPYALHVSVHLNALDGRWRQAYADGSEGARIAAEVDNQGQRHQLLGHLALIEAARGREDECRAHVAEARAATEGTERSPRPELGEALGLLELGLGRPGHALRHLEEATAVHGTARTGCLSRPSLGDLVEAHVRLGSTPPRDLVAAIDAAAAGDFDGSAAVAERCHAMLADESLYSARFIRALDLHGQRWPFARARTALSYGERLRRSGRRVDARPHLRAALETFDQLGAQPWAERAAAELRSTGERIRRRDPTAAEQLTPQELQIALAVAAGATNREAGAALFLSHKTIEHHLGQVYRKLGLRSRSELARALTAAPTVAPPTPGSRHLPGTFASAAQTPATPSPPTGAR